MLKRFAILLPLVIILSGCQATKIVFGGIDNPITPKAAIVLHQAFFVGVEIPVSIYFSWPRCSKSPPPCSSQKIVTPLRAYVLKANKAIRKLDEWAYGNRQLDGVALYNAAKIAIEITQDFAIKNGVPSVKEVI